MKLAIATCAKFPLLEETDKPLIALFAQHGINAQAQVWNDPNINWKQYEAVLIRSVWDYHLNIDAFINWLNLLKAQNIYVLNPIDTVITNMNKFYLQQLHLQGAEIIPTLFLPKSNKINLKEVQQKNWHKAVIKPAISCGAYLTKVFDANQIAETEAEYETVITENALLVQPYIEEVTTDGELSLLFFNRKYSHAVHKIPKAGDFRVQTEHGGITTSYIPHNTIIDTASQILNLIEGPLLYARVDGIILNNRFTLMELELIEPYLFFNYSPGSIEKFVAAAVNLIQQQFG